MKNFLLCLSLVSLMILYPDAETVSNILPEHKQYIIDNYDNLTMDIYPNVLIAYDVNTARMYVSYVFDYGETWVSIGKESYYLDVNNEQVSVSGVDLETNNVLLIYLRLNNEEKVGVCESIGLNCPAEIEPTSEPTEPPLFDEDILNDVNDNINQTNTILSAIGIGLAFDIVYKFIKSIFRKGE